jgi:hypothetical protein
MIVNSLCLLIIVYFAIQLYTIFTYQFFTPESFYIFSNIHWKRSVLCIKHNTLPAHVIITYTMLAHLIQHNTCKGIGAYMCITHQRQYFSCDPHSRICFVFINFVIHYFSNFHIYVFIDLIFLKDIQQLHFQTYYF